MAQNQNSPAEAGPSITGTKSTRNPFLARQGGPKTTPPPLRPADWIRGVEAIKFGSDYHLKLMLLSIARGSANDGSGVCTHLSHEHLAVAAEVHRDHVWRLVKRAEEMGLLVKQQRHDKYGQRLRTEYRLTITPLRENDDLKVKENRRDLSPTNRPSKRKQMSDGSANRHEDETQPTSDQIQPTSEPEPSDLQRMSADHLEEDHPEADHPSDHLLEDSERRARAREAEHENLPENDDQEANDQTAPEDVSPQPDDSPEDDDSAPAGAAAPEAPSDIEDPDVVFAERVFAAIGPEMTSTARGVIPEATDLELAQMVEAIAADLRRGTEPPPDFPLTRQQADAVKVAIT